MADGYAADAVLDASARVAGLSTAGRVAFGSACGVAIVIQVVGAFWYTGVSDVAVLAAQGPNKMRAAWDIRNASFIAELKHAPAPADLAVNLRGHIDLVALRDKGDDKAEWQIEIQGWTLAGSRSPAAVHVTLDGRLMASTGEFFERPDVVRALGAPGQSGWRLTLPANDLAPGEHAVAVLVQAYVGSEARLLQERTFTAPAGLRGYIDLVAVRETGGDSAERQVEIQGWALAGNRSPAAVQVTVDSRPMGETAEFFERSDVARALGEPSRSGWRFTLPANDLAPGEHSVAVLVRVDEGRKPRLLQERTFTLPADHQTDRRDRELANAARLAAKVLAERQQSSGYWLTWFTDTARYEHPRQEMNTFVNAVMIDVAAPVAERAGLAGMLGRARDFLASQIEGGGLVRYHGLPDAPTIGSLGCAITPDADDTALVWRVAPGERSELLATALAALNRFRTADGLYRTWLAPQERYECIDPGKDPNPADIAIQIHVLMLLAQADPPAARALCEALQQRAGDENLWVYYKMAPPVVILRLRDLRKAGCPLQLPPARLRTMVPGQEAWIEATQLLQRMDSGEDRHADHARAAELLHELASDEFSLLARTPPLIYHNDLTASVLRFYWSEELGYALWLRLYYENERSRSRLSCPGSDTKQGCVQP
jgi:hypothetical protein